MLRLTGSVLCRGEPDSASRRTETEFRTFHIDRQRYKELFRFIAICITRRIKAVDPVHGP